MHISSHLTTGSKIIKLKCSSLPDNDDNAKESEQPKNAKFKVNFQKGKQFMLESISYEKTPYRNPLLI